MASKWLSKYFTSETQTMRDRTFFLGSSKHVDGNYCFENISYAFCWQHRGKLPLNLGTVLDI